MLLFKTTDKRNLEICHSFRSHISKIITTKERKKQMKMSKWGDEEERETFDKSLANDPKMTKMT